MQKENGILFPENRVKLTVCLPKEAHLLLIGFLFRILKKGVACMAIPLLVFIRRSPEGNLLIIPVCIVS